MPIGTDALRRIAFLKKELAQSIAVFGELLEADDTPDGEIEVFNAFVFYCAHASRSLDKITYLEDLNLDEMLLEPINTDIVQQYFTIEAGLTRDKFIECLEAAFKCLITCKDNIEDGAGCYYNAIHKEGPAVIEKNAFVEAVRPICGTFIHRMYNTIG